LFRAVIVHLAKDLRVEFRSRSAVNVIAAFAVITTLSIGLAAGGGGFAPRVHGILLWVVIFFSAMSGLSHAYTREEEEGTALFLRINSTPAVVYTAKLLFNIAVLLAVSLVVTPLYFFFLSAPAASPLTLAAVVGAGSIAIASSATLLAAMTAKAGGKGSLFTVLSFPVVLPALWVSIRATTLVLNTAAGPVSAHLFFLLAFSGALVAVSYMLFEHIWVE